MARVEPAKISYAQKYQMDRDNSYNNLVKQGYKPNQLEFLKKPVSWRGIEEHVNNRMVDNPNYVDTSKGSMFSYDTGANKLSYAPKGSTFYTDTDVGESDLTPELMGEIREKYGSIANNPAFASVGAKYNQLLNSSRAQELGAADPTLLGGSKHALSSDVLNKMWR